MCLGGILSYMLESFRQSACDLKRLIRQTPYIFQLKEKFLSRERIF